MRVFSWYGANPLHLLVLVGCFALAGYAGVRLFAVQPWGVAIWLLGAVLAHDLVLFPLYALADRSVRGVLRHRPAPLPSAPWINYVRVPVVVSALLFLVYFPVILRLPGAFFEGITTYTTDVYAGRYLGIVAALFLVSAVAFALRLRRSGRGSQRDPGR